jgi:hypothetical protein
MSISNPACFHLKRLAGTAAVLGPPITKAAAGEGNRGALDLPADMRRARGFGPRLKSAISKPARKAVRRLDSSQGKSPISKAFFQQFKHDGKRPPARGALSQAI